MVKIRPVIAKILLLLLLFLIVAVVFVVVVFDVAVIVVLDPETFLYSLVKIGSVTAEILGEGSCHCCYSFFAGLRPAQKLDIEYHLYHI